MAQPLEQLIGGKYEILQKIKEGGMGSIYRVRHRLLEEERVVKVLKPQYALDEEFRARFQNEARAAIRLRHPNIAHLYDFSVDDTGNSYIVMEYIAGVTLQQLLANTGPPSLGLAIEIARQCLEAIGYLHRQGFVHRDIASDNMMLTTDFDDAPLVKLIDLGIAKAQESDLDLTATGVFMGKARYSPPEQFAVDGGAATLDRRSDIYSFGVMMYELLTGRFPVEGTDFSQIVAGHLFREPLGFDETDPEGRLPQGLREIVLRTLAKEPAGRYESMEALHEALEPFLEPQASKKREFTVALETTSRKLAAAEPPEKPGSTQNRLDGQFPAGEASGVGDGDEREAASASGRRPTLQPEPAAASPAQPRMQSTVHQPRPIPLRRRRGFVVGLGLAAGAALAVAGWLTLGSKEPAIEAPAASGALVLEPPARWSSAVEEIDSGDWSAWDEPALAEPPPIAEEATDDEPPVVAQPAEPARAPATNATPPVESQASPIANPIANPQSPSTDMGQPEDSIEGGPVRSSRPPQSAGELLRGTPGVVPPVLRALPRVTPPPGARERDKEILIVVRVLVDERGRVLDAEIEKGPLFKARYRDRALEIARQARFRPAQKEGVPGRMWTEVRVVFNRGRG